MPSTPPDRIALPPPPRPTDFGSALDTSTPPSTSSEPPLQQATRAARVTAAQAALGVGSGTGSSLPSSLLAKHRQPSSSSAVGVGGGGGGGVRPSFSTGRGLRPSVRRSSRATHPGLELDDDDIAAKLPSLVPGIRPAYSTPLPVLPMVVLCIAMLSELLAANLSSPFMLQMVEGFYLDSGREKNTETEAAVGLWTGNLVSVFYITQFVTSLLWSSIADRHGRRAVLVASMTGSAIALVMFGTSQSLPEAICVRLAQGVFGGAIGVFRGSVRDLTDDTNATRAYAMLGFSWGFGGVIGPILGGVFETPALNFPNLFLGKVGLFKDYPYLLPTLLGAVILIIGAVLACFLSWDGGVRGGSRIALEVEKDEPLAPGRHAQEEEETAAVAIPQTLHAGPSLRPKTSGYFSPREEEVSMTPQPRRESFSTVGTAYGYGGIRSKHPTLAARAALHAARHGSTASALVDDEEPHNRRVSLAAKFLLANEENSFNINDLWVSAAVAQETAVFEDDDDEDDIDDIVRTDEDAEAINITPHRSPPASPGGHRSPSSFTHRVSHSRLSSIGLQRPSFSSRKFSVSSGVMPTLFSHTGLATPPAVAAAYEESMSPSGPLSPSSNLRSVVSPSGTVRRVGGLDAIVERSTSATVVDETSPLVSPNIIVEHDVQVETRWWRLLPILVICQYGLLSFHDTTHGQIFLSFLVTPYQSGGVGLSPAHYSFLVALMCLCQLVYQFYLYPRLGPPLGRFSHIQMFRLGSMLYIPAYLLLPLLHTVSSPDSDGGFVVMSMLSVITAIRYCGGTFAYTAVMILMNAMSPPHVVGLANGLAQSTVSAARFFGPALGGAIWSGSINGNPNGYPHGFHVVAIISAVQILGSFLLH